MSSLVQAPTNLTGEDCVLLIDRLRRSFGVAGVRIEKTDFWGDLERVRWLATFRGPVCSPFGDALFRRKEVAAGLWEAAGLVRTGLALEVASRLPGYAKEMGALRHLRLSRAPSDDADDPNQKAWDRVYQAEIAARFSFLCNDLRFGEPDLRVPIKPANCDFSFECKRVRSRDALGNAIRKAVSQIRRSGTLGVVAVCLDHVVDRLAASPWRSDFAEVCGQRQDDVMRPHADRIERALGGPPVVGIVATTTFQLLGRTWCGGDWFANTSFRVWRGWIGEQSEGVVNYIAGALATGEERLKALQRPQ